MNIRELHIPDVKIITPLRFTDNRGFFSEIYNQATFQAAGLKIDFVQDNQSLSVHPGTIRGLHFQKPPYAQAKLVSVLRGSILDVAVDLRQNSRTYDQYVSATLTAENGCQIFIPEGFAHGFCTLEPNTEVFYKVSCHYAKEHDAGIRWDDPGLDIKWPISSRDVFLSEKDKNLPLLKDIVSPFSL